MSIGVNLLGCVALALGALSGQSQTVTKAPTLKISIDEQAVVRPYSRWLLGMNFEWGYSQDRVQIDPVTGQEDVRLAQLCKGLPLPLNRMAGTVSQEFHWKQALGDWESRAAQKLTPWGGARQVRVGPIEWIRWVLSIDPQAQFVWTLNVLKESPQDAADLVQFLTGDAKAAVPEGKTNWAQKRVSLGLVNPVRVAYWELGNELNLKPNAHKDYVWTAEQYIQTVKPIIAAVRSVDSKARLVAAGSCYWDDWDDKVLRALDGEIDGIAPHYYPRSVARGLDESILRPEAFQGLEFDFVQRWMTSLAAKLHQTPNQSRAVHIVMTEHAMWPLSLRDRDWKATWYQTHSLDGVLSTAYFISQAMKYPEVEAMNYHNFSSGPWGLIYRDDTTGQLYATGMVDLFRLLGEIPEGSLIESKITEDALTGQTKYRQPEVSAMKHGHGLALLLVNPGEPRSVEIALPKSRGYVSAKGIYGEELDAHNTVDQSQVSISPLALGTKGKPLGTFALPGQSVVVIFLE